MVALLERMVLLAGSVSSADLLPRSLGHTLAGNIAYYSSQLPQGLVLRIAFQQHYRSYVWCLINVPSGAISRWSKMFSRCHLPWSEGMVFWQQTPSGLFETQWQ